MTPATSGNKSSPGAKQRVHWTRVVHVADGLLDDDGRSLQGYKKKETPSELTLFDPATQLTHVIPKEDLVGQREVGRGHSFSADGPRRVLHGRFRLSGGGRARVGFAGCRFGLRTTSSVGPLPELASRLLHRELSDEAGGAHLGLHRGPTPSGELGKPGRELEGQAHRRVQQEVQQGLDRGVVGAVAVH